MVPLLQWVKALVPAFFQSRSVRRLVINFVGNPCKKKIHQRVKIHSKRHWKNRLVLIHAGGWQSSTWCIPPRQPALLQDDAVMDDQ